jgi:phosphatidylinositol glycan class T
MILQLFTLILTLLTLASCSDYHERLLLHPLPGDALLASFNFRSNATEDSFEKQNFRLFPRSLGQILQHTHAKELHLRFTVGGWDDEKWGPRPWQGAREGGTGVELWAWVEAESDQEANKRWFALTNALSGLFCASLNFIDSTRTIRPVHIFEPEGTHPPNSLPNLHLLHGVLPHEVVCTENLTPFIKLLPCKGNAGISSLLDGHKLFDASYQAMSIDVRPVCDQENCFVQIEQTVDMVLDIERSKRPRDNPIPRPLQMDQIECDDTKPYSSGDSCFPKVKASDPAWKLEEIFGRPIKGSCPLTDDVPPESTTVCLRVPPERIVKVIGATARRISFEEGNLRCYEPDEQADFSLDLREQEIRIKTPLPTNQLRAHRSITGYGQEHGGMHTVFYNPSTTDSLEVLYLESLPWYLKPYLHTLQASTSPPSNISTIKEIFYRPALDRHRGTHLEVNLIIPPASTLSLTYDFDKAFLRYTEYPPDANRGFDVAAAVVRLLPQTSHESLDTDSRRRGIYLRTTSLLLPLPTPDFSMPYNVIILTSTVMALGFGSIFNIITRRFVAADEVPAAVMGVALGGIIAKVKGRIRGMFRRGHEKTE